MAGETTNPICRALGVRYPILLGGLLQVGTAPLVAAVSEAGGFGIFGAGTWRKDMLLSQVRRVRELTDKPFGVNIVVNSPFSEEQVDLVIEEGVTAVSTSAGTPARYTARLKEGGVFVMHVVPTVEYARLAQSSGVDAVIAEGSESGGFTSLEEISTMVLVPQAVDAVDLPVIAAGGIGDARGFAAALALGAAGVQVGTRFLGTTEAEVAGGYKLALIMAEETDTRLVRSSKAAQRQVKKDLRERVAAALEDEDAARDLLKNPDESDSWEAHLKDRKVPQVMSAGQVAGLVREIVPCREIIEGMVRGARDFFRSAPDRFDFLE